MSTPLRKTTGLALHGATVALTPARAVTSHLRKRYHEKYHGKYRFAPLVFAFDLAVFGIAATLVAINIVIYLAVPAPAPSLGLVFSTAPIKTAAPQALVAEVEARGSDSKGQVSLRWNLPAGTEVLDAEPPLNSLGEASLGALKAGEKVSSRLIVRFFAPQGALRFGFQLIDGTSVLTGYENRNVIGSALSLEPLFESSSLADGRIPVRLSNRSNARLESITLTGFDVTSIDALDPDADRILLAEPGQVSALMRAYPLVERLLTVSPVDVSSTITLRPSTGNTARLDVSMPTAGKVEVYHPGLAHPHTKAFDVPAGNTALTIPLDRRADDAAWYAVAVTQRGRGPIAESRVTTPFNVSTAIRYYATTGDQIGIGPLPPRVGEETRYWFQAMIGPTTRDLADISLRIRLPDSVRLTGRDALPSGGGISEAEGDVIWSLPYLAANSEGATVRFEIAFTPTESMRGTTPALIQSISGKAIEVVSGIKLESLSGGLDTSLPEDARANGKGIVQ